MAYLFLILAFVTNGLANVLLKIAATRGVVLDWSLGLPRLIALNSFLLLGLVLFATNILFYLVALRAFPLSVAYPVMVGMSFLIVSTAGLFLLHESIGWVQVVGYLCILAGIVLVVSYGK